MKFPKADRRRGGRIGMGSFTPERNRTIKWQGWLLDNDISREKQNEIAEKYPDMIERLEYIKTLTEPTFHDKVNHYTKVMTSKTAEFELPE